MRILHLCLCVAVGGCSAVTSTIPTVAPDSEFELAPGGSVRISGLAVVVSLDSVTGDSRCPVDAVCVWEGEATLRLSLDSARVGRNVELRTSGTARQVSAFGVAIEFRALRPAPRTQTTPRQQDYVATLRVVPHSGP